MKIPTSSPLHNIPDVFWSVRVNDEGVPDPARFHALVNEGKINLVAPTRVIRYTGSGTDEFSAPTITAETSDGQHIMANAVVVCTGYGSSWAKLFDGTSYTYNLLTLS